MKFQSQVKSKVMKDVNEDLGKKLFYSTSDGEVKVFENGNYEWFPEGKSGVSGGIYELPQIVSAQMNQLKGELFNLVESAVPNEKQADSLKRLVKGFCNRHYRAMLNDMEGTVRRMGFKYAFFNGSDSDSEG